ncbi:conjugal transfer protein TraL [Chromobacterium vaccinii]|nr:conjugal transfer protein TraL [Chromobacterium vaccinii]
MTYNDTHITLQGKGGVGKSHITSLLAQAIWAIFGIRPLGIDTDPVNKTLMHFPALQARGLDILNQDNQINSRQFDTMVEWLLEHDGPAVIDNGATSFIPATGYLAETGAIDVLNAAGRRVFIHTVLVGGQAMDDTIDGLAALLDSTSAPIVVWENEHFGPVEREGRRFRDSSVYHENRERIAGIVTLRRPNADLAGRDIAELSIKGQTFAEALASPEWGRMPKHRLQMVWADYLQQLRPILTQGLPEELAA